MNGASSSNGTMPNTAKKRKAPDHDSDLDHTKAKGTPTKRPAKTARSKSPSYADEVPFKTECPVVKRKKNDTAFLGKEKLADNFTFEFAVRPGSKWGAMKSYRNVKYSEHTFTTGGIVYINKQFPPPPPPPQDATDAEILAYDRRNFWVARIADTRAESEKEVFLRVFWLYWPEELPMGRQPYHSDHELILSNAMDIVDAQTISAAADAAYFDDNAVESRPADRFWRQTFDVSKLGKTRQGGLSVLKKHCKCQQPFNPDKFMFRCKNAECGTWNHEACLEQEVLEQALEHCRNGTWSQMDATPEHKSEDNKVRLDDTAEGSIGGRFLSPLRELGQFVQKKMLPAVASVVDPVLNDMVDNNEVKTPGKSIEGQDDAAPPRTPKSPKQQWKITIVEHDEQTDEPVVARLEEVRSGKNWLIRVNCLRCGKPMD